MPTTASTPYRISVLLVTYNHENYIRQALDSLFGQVINGPIELIVADDGSSDNTVAIIKEYENKDDRFHFNYLDNKTNRGITKNYQRAFSACSADYVAVLEGDDYWINPFKLQRQTEFLDLHWECDLCSVNYLVFEQSRFHFYPRTAIGGGYRLISARDLIADNLVGNFSTCMYRKSALLALPKGLFEICSYDWIVNICVARSSLIGFIEEAMSVYRLHSKGVWTQTAPTEKLKTQLALIPAYDKLTDQVYHSEFELLSNRLQHTVSMSNLTHIAVTARKPTACLLTWLVDCLPPIFLVVMRALVPPKLKHFIIKTIQPGSL
ncbi:MAG: glycosyltransferase [Methylobacter sp.]|nr:glycosyltransferase [Methylobacter sp.]MDP2428658.1 glycosyltransferase [Methylobacter sp.]MDP3055133.1 glycosyltransferase [Methylobacter sp.]MDP3364204.1 glycosyltransferase [Methylobacter sp.]MDZ4217442.1 glycosyltransferase [Methylobacter sp.]